jgi:protein-disulfide isomerase
MRRQLLYIVLGTLGLLLVVAVLIIASLFSRSTVNFTNLEEAPNAPSISSYDVVRGSANPDIVLVMYGSFTCQSCRDMLFTIDRVMRDYNIAFVWKDLPNDSLNAESTAASVAARCANEQGSFWPYFDALFKEQGLISNEYYSQVAADLELREKRFAKCLENAETIETLNVLREEAEALKITATPTLYVNNQRFTGAVREEQLRTFIERILAN